MTAGFEDDLKFSSPQVGQCAVWFILNGFVCESASGYHVIRPD